MSSLDKPNLWLIASIYRMALCQYASVMTIEKQKRTAQAADKYIVRLPPGMRDEISAAARASNRSMNAEIVSRLEVSQIDEIKRQLEDVKSMLRELLDRS
ncbi:MAG: Arc family DNA-binding protein [Telluria sp.]